MSHILIDNLPSHFHNLYKIEIFRSRKKHRNDYQVNPSGLPVSEESQ